MRRLKFQRLKFQKKTSYVMAKMRGRRARTVPRSSEAVGRADTGRVTMAWILKETQSESSDLLSLFMSCGVPFKLFVAGRVMFGGCHA